MVRTTALRLIPAVACGAGLALTLAGPAAAQIEPPEVEVEAEAAVQLDPPGNNGTVKIDDVVFDDHPDNQPHVGCEFQVDFYGFDQGDLTATVLFEAVPPTVGDGVPPGEGQELLTDELAIGEDAAGGGTDLDASGTYDLTEELAGIQPHPEQGWHVRLTVHAEGSQGADTKHKVFWVEGCEPPTTSTTTPGSSTTTVPGPGTTSTTTPGSTTSTSAPPTSGPTTSAPPTPSTTVASSGGGGLPVTGSNVLPLAGAGAALIAAGATGVVIARRFRLTGGR